MRIKENKTQNNNINIESEEAFENFQKKRISMNIKLHKIFFILCILINLIFFGFIVFYKKKISELQTISNSYTGYIEGEESSIILKRRSLNHKMVNVAAFSYHGLFRCSLVFAKTEELEMAKKFIVDFQAESNNNINIDKMYTTILFQSVTDDDSIESLFENIMFYDNVMLLIGLNNNKRFGIYIENIILPDDDEKFIDVSDKVFLFSFETKKYYKFKDVGNSFFINKEKIVIGDNDIIINDNFFEKGGEINFPFRSFDTTNGDLGAFNDNNGHIDIVYVEALFFSY